MNATQRLYAGDIVRVDLAGLAPDPARGVVRAVSADGGRIRVQIYDGPIWLPRSALFWEGECLTKVPRTEWGWRRLGRRLVQGTGALA